MSQESDLKKMGQRAYLFYPQDGFIDIAIGFMAISFGLLVAMDREVFWFIFYVLGVGIYRATKKWIAYPKIGYVKLSENRKGKLAILIGAIIVPALVFMVLGLVVLSLKG